MEQRQPIAQLRARVRSMGAPVFIGFFLIVYAAFGLVWFQQQREQEDVEAEIANLLPIVTRPVVISDELEAGYEEAQESIPGRLTGEDVFLVVLDIAERSGFDTAFGSETGDVSENKVLSITVDAVRAEKVGGGSYQVLPFSMDVAGSYSAVLELVASLEAQQVLKTVALEKLDINETEEGATAFLNFSVYTRP